MSHETIYKLTRALYLGILDADEEWRLEQTEPVSEHQREKEISRLETDLREVQSSLAAFEYSWAEDFIESISHTFVIHFETDSLDHRLLCREVLKVYARAIPIQIARWHGQYDKDPHTDIITPNEEETLENIREVTREVGRPSAKWEMIKCELLSMEQEGRLPEIKHGWRTRVCESLAAWYSVNYPNRKAIQAKTMTTKPIIKAELDRIDPSSNETP